MISSFVDQLSTVGVLLLDHYPEKLDELDLKGSSTFSLGGHIVSNYLRSEICQRCVDTVGLSLKDSVRRAIQKFHDLLEDFKTFSSYLPLLDKIEKVELRKQWKRDFSKSVTGALVPLGWRYKADRSENGHLYLAYVDKRNSRIHLINTYPNDDQGYKKINAKEYEQSCAISLQVRKVSKITEKIFNAFWGLTPKTLGELKERADEDDTVEEALLKERLASLKRHCKVLQASETPISQITLHFGYGCTVTVFQAFLQTLLEEENPDLSGQASHALKAFSSLWMTGLELYVLQKYKSAVMFMGKENFETVTQGIKNKLISQSTNDKSSGNAGLLSLFREIVDTYSSGSGDADTGDKRSPPTPVLQNSC
jgi:hypothetical protein